jgi:hypothetical protein
VGRVGWIGGAVARWTKRACRRVTDSPQAREPSGPVSWVSWDHERLRCDRSRPRADARARLRWTDVSGLRAAAWRALLHPRGGGRCPVLVLVGDTMMTRRICHRRRSERARVRPGAHALERVTPRSSRDSGRRRQVAGRAPAFATPAASWCAGSVRARGAIVEAARAVADSERFQRAIASIDAANAVIERDRARRAAEGAGPRRARVGVDPAARARRGEGAQAGRPRASRAALGDRALDPAADRAGYHRWRVALHAHHARIVGAAGRRRLRAGADRACRIRAQARPRPRPGRCRRSRTPSAVFLDTQFAGSPRPAWMRRSSWPCCARRCAR